MFTNPRGRVVDTLTNRVEEIRYKHKADGKWYKHKFKPGASLRLLQDGDARLERADGKPVWGEFAGDFGGDDMKFLTNPGKRKTHMARRTRNRMGRFTKRHRVGAKRRTHHTNAPAKRRRRRVTASAAPRKRRKRHAVRAYRTRAHMSNPHRRRRRSYRHNPARILDQVMTAAKDGALVTAGQIVTRKIGALAKTYVPGIGSLTGVASVAPTVLAATVATFVAHKAAPKVARIVSAGAFAEVFNQVIASQPSLQSALGAWPGSVSLPHNAGGNKRMVQGTRGLSAWAQPVIVPKMRQA